MKAPLYRSVCAVLAGIATMSSASGQARLWDKPGACDRECLKDMPTAT